MSNKIDDAKLKAFLRLKPTLEDTAAFFECSTKTIQRYCEEKYNMNFVQFRDQNMVHTRHSLIRKAIELSLQGNTAILIFTLKNMCGWTDKAEISSSEEKPITLNYKL